MSASRKLLYRRVGTPRNRFIRPKRNEMAKDGNRTLLSHGTVFTSRTREAFNGQSMVSRFRPRVNSAVRVCIFVETSHRSKFDYYVASSVIEDLTFASIYFFRFLLSRCNKKCVRCNKKCRSLVFPRLCCLCMCVRKDGVRQ